MIEKESKNKETQNQRSTANKIITREELMREFDSLSSERIIYVGAPAGFGKTVAVRQWVGRGSQASAIISLDEYDNDPVRFCQRFCEALRICQPKNLELIKIVSHPAFSSAPDEFTIRAIGTLRKRKNTVLVLDDLHQINHEKVIRLIQVFLKRLPENFQIVLVGRNNLHTGFSDIWLNGGLARITSEHFLFSKEEIAALYKKRGNPITAEDAENIYRFTEGWAIGVNALCLAGGEPSGEIMSYLDDFIKDSMWEKWSEEIREFMLKTAMARELTPSLCAELTGLTDCEDILRRLVSQNAFVSITGDECYKYHQLFQDFLERMMKAQGKDFVCRQWELAGNWYLKQGSFHDAVNCFIKCDNTEGIANSFGLLTGAGYEFLHIDRVLTVTRETAIEKVAEKYPYIYSTLMWTAYNEGRSRDMIRYADLFYENYQEVVRLLPGQALDIVLVWLVDFRISISELLQMADKFLGAQELGEMGGMGVSYGLINQNMPLLHRGTRDFSDLAVGDVAENVLMAKAALGGLFGEVSVILAECLLAGIFYEQGHLEKAYRHALAANSITEYPSSETKFFALVVLIYVLEALDDEQQVQRRIKEIEKMIENDGAYYLNSNFKALVARHELREGNMEAAARWLETRKTALLDNLYFYNIYENFTTSRAYIVLGDYDASIILLLKLLKLAKTYNRPIDILETQILLAISYWKKKGAFEREALQILEEAVTLAYGYGYTQPFINDGAELLGMMLRLQKTLEQRSEETPLSFVKMLNLKMKDSPAQGLTSRQDEPTLKYSQKQKMVMKLLCDGKTYKQIAEAMGIKLPTLRSHISLIYKKLNVTNASDAVKKITATGVLQES